MQKSVLLGALVILACGALAGADYWLKERTQTNVPSEEPIVAMGSSSSAATFTSSVPTVITEPLPSSSPASEATGTASSSSKTVVKKGTSTKKQTSVNVDEVFAKLGLEKQDTTEASVLTLVSRDLGVKTAVLLLNGDRAFLFSWIENDDVKAIFGAVKQALQMQFSGNVTDLVDETRRPADGPPVDVLSFFDPAISSEKILFIRVRNRLYEIHTAKNGESMIDRLVEELSK